MFKNIKLHYSFIILFLFTVSCTNLSVISDEELLDQFYQNKSNFSQLIKMFKEDKTLQSLWPESMTPKNAIDEQRWNTYRTLMKNTKIRGLHTNRAEHIEITLFRESRTYINRFDKGYLWSEGNPKPLFDSLNSRSDKLQPYAFNYRRIGGNWYLYLQNQSD